MCLICVAFSLLTRVAWTVLCEVVLGRVSQCTTLQPHCWIWIQCCCVAARLLKRKDHTINRMIQQNAAVVHHRYWKSSQTTPPKTSSLQTGCSNFVLPYPSEPPYSIVLWQFIQTPPKTFRAFSENSVYFPFRFLCNTETLKPKMATTLPKTDIQNWASLFWHASDPPIHSVLDLHKPRYHILGDQTITSTWTSCSDMKPPNWTRYQHYNRYVCICIKNI